MADGISIFGAIRAGFVAVLMSARAVGLILVMRQCSDSGTFKTITKTKYVEAVHQSVGPIEKV